MVQDAHTALTDRRSSNAEQAFRQALTLMETTTPKVTWLRNAKILFSGNKLTLIVKSPKRIFFVCVFPQDLGLSTQDKLLLLYGHASALTDVGQPEVTHKSETLLSPSERSVLQNSRRVACMSPLTVCMLLF